MTSVFSIIRSAIPAHHLKNPEILRTIHFDTMTTHNKLALLLDNYDLFSKYINPHIAKSASAIHILYTDDRYKSLRQYFTYDDDLILRLPDDTYTDVLVMNPNKFNKERYDKLLMVYKRKLAVNNPLVWLKLAPWPTLSTYDIEHILSTSRSKIVYSIVANNIDKISVNYTIFKCLYKFNNDYKDVLMNNLDRVCTTTVIRSVFSTYPELLLDATAEQLEKSKLSAKEWLLFINRIKYDNALKGWKLSDDMKAWLKLEATVEILNGKSKTSTHLTAAMGIL